MVHAGQSGQELLQRCGLLSNRNRVHRRQYPCEAQGGREVHSDPSTEGRAQSGQSRWQKSPLRSAAEQLLPDRHCVLLLAGRRHMKLVLVNGRTPRPQSFCAWCCEPIVRATCASWPRILPAAITTATSVTARIPTGCSKGMY